MNIYVYFEFVVLMINESTLFLKSESYFYVTKKSVTNIYIIYIRKNILLKDIKIFASVKYYIYLCTQKNQ